MDGNVSDEILVIPEQPFPFQTVKIFPSKLLGQGSYGYVCRGKCDRLPVAAKRLNPIFFQYGADPGLSGILNKFTAECRLLSTLSHPNVVQFIGICKTAATDGGAPVLVTELMDETLWKFINRSRDSKLSVPFHTEVNIAYDIALALSYLHYKGIIHRDLSSNNVLLKGTTAKVTDFGMARLRDASKKFTQCPGTPIFMPPEALFDTPTYSTQLDVFSWAVVCIHLLSGRDPNPGPASRDEGTDERGRQVMVRVPEEERRAEDIKEINPAHPLLPLILQSLQYQPEKRPVADQLCDQIEAICSSQVYLKSLHEVDPVSQLKAELSEYSIKVSSLQRQLSEARSKETELRAIISKYGTEESNAGVPLAKKENDPISNETSSTSGNQQGSVSPIKGLFEWKTIAEGTPCLFPSGSSIATLGDCVYFSRPHSTIVHVYSPDTRNWSVLTHSCPVENFSLCTHSGKLLAVGGVTPGTLKCSSRIYSYNVSLSKSWDDKFVHSMYYGRAFPAAVASEAYLVVAGGYDPKTKAPVSHVEVFDGSQWFTTYSLPTPLMLANAVISNGYVYIVGGRKDGGAYSFYVYCSSLSGLFGSSSCFIVPRALREVWKAIHSPVAMPAALVASERIFLMGGVMGEEGGYSEYSSNVFKYRPAEENFSISVMPHARGGCLATVLPSNKEVMVVGGCGNMTIDIGTVSVNNN